MSSLSPSKSTNMDTVTSPPGSPAKAPLTLPSTLSVVEAKDQDVTAFVQDMLSKMELDFQQTGNGIMNRMSRMGEKMDTLEQSITDLMHDAGLGENTNSEDEDDVTATASTPAKTSNSKNTV